MKGGVISWRNGAVFKGCIGCAGGHGRVALPHEMLRKGKNSLIKVRDEDAGCFKENDDKVSHGHIAVSQFVTAARLS